MKTLTMTRRVAGGGVAVAGSTQNHTTQPRKVLLPGSSRVCDAIGGYTSVTRLSGNNDNDNTMKLCHTGAHLQEI